MLDSQLISVQLSSYNAASRCVNLVATAPNPTIVGTQELSTFGNALRDLFGNNDIAFSQLALSVTATTLAPPPPTPPPTVITAAPVPAVTVSTATSASQNNSQGSLLLIVVVVAILLVLIGLGVFYVSKSQSKNLAILQAEMAVENQKPPPPIYNPGFNHVVTNPAYIQTPESAMYAPYGAGTLHQRQAIQNGFYGPGMGHNLPPHTPTDSPARGVQAFPGYDDNIDMTQGAPIRFPREEDTMSTEPHTFQRMIPMPTSGGHPASSAAAAPPREHVPPPKTPERAPRPVPVAEVPPQRAPEPAAAPPRPVPEEPTLPAPPPRSAPAPAPPPAPVAVPLPAPPHSASEPAEPEAPPPPTPKEAAGPKEAKAKAAKPPKAKTAAAPPAAAAAAAPAKKRGSKKKKKGKVEWNLPYGRPETEATLRERGNRGAFIVRPTKNTASGVVVSILDHNNQVRHQPVYIDDNFGVTLYTLNKPLKNRDNGAETLEDLLRHFMVVPLTAGGLTLEKMEL